MANGSGQRLLEADQERELALRWRELGDRKAADELVTKHLRLAAGVARCGNQLAKSCLPQPRVGRDAHGLEHFSLGPSL